MSSFTKSTRTSPRGMVGAEALSTNPNPNQTCLESEILQVATLQVQKSKSDFRVPNRMETIKPHPGRSLPVPNTLSDLQNTRNHLAQRPDFWRSSGVLHSSLSTGSTSSRGMTSKNVFFEAFPYLAPPQKKSERSNPLAPGSCSLSNSHSRRPKISYSARSQYVTSTFSKSAFGAKNLRAIG